MKLTTSCAKAASNTPSGIDGGDARFADHVCERAGQTARPAADVEERHAGLDSGDPDECLRERGHIPSDMAPIQLRRGAKGCRALRLAHVAIVLSAGLFKRVRARVGFAA